jgi:hypothetical protein
MAAVLMSAAIAVCACGGGDDEAAPASGGGGGGNTTLSISGNPSTTVMQGQSYSFTPSAAPSSASLTFSIANKPAWAAFNPATGQLNGTPTSADVGSYANIQISVSDGTTTMNLASFTIQVVAMTTSSATLSWTPPTQNSDGSALTNLAGYKVYWGTTQGSYSNAELVGNNVTSHMVSNLTPATWYFVVTARNTQGVESAYSNVAQKTVQ